MTLTEHREYKGVAKGEVRDHMTGLELAFVNVAEQATIVNIQSDAVARGGHSVGVAPRYAFIPSNWYLLEYKII